MSAEIKNFPVQNHRVKPKVASDVVLQISGHLCDLSSILKANGFADIAASIDRASVSVCAASIMMHEAGL